MLVRIITLLEGFRGQTSVIPLLARRRCSVLTLCTSFWQSLILCTSLWQAILYWHASIFLYVCIQPFSLK